VGPTYVQITLWGMSDDMMKSNNKGPDLEKPLTPISFSCGIDDPSKWVYKLPSATNESGYSTEVSGVAMSPQG
jgi:hypothetical protein